MSLLGGLLDKIFGLGEKIIDRHCPDTNASREQQTGINRSEIEGAPTSHLRLWRSFLGWCLSIGFVWEMIRPVILHYWPTVNLPPSMAKEITTLLLGMLGLGF